MPVCYANVMKYLEEVLKSIILQSSASGIFFVRLYEKEVTKERLLQYALALLVAQFPP